MRTRSFFTAFILSLQGALCAAQPTAAAPPGNAAAEACEAAVVETIKDLRGRAAAQEVLFIAARRVALSQSAAETALRGEGRYRGSAGVPRAFTYSCAYDAQTGSTSGVVFRESGAGPAAAEKPWEPDLTRLSPEACEAAAAASLTSRYPQAARISFQTDTRKLQPALNARTSLAGRGQVERAPGLNPTGFSYRCEFEPRSGKVVAVQTGE